MNRIHSLTRFVLMFVLLCGGLSSHAEDDITPSVDEAMIKLSDEIARYIAAESDAKGQIAIGSFQGPAGSGAGARIVHALKENLKSKCQVTDVGAAYTVSGKFMGQKIDGKFVTVIEAGIDDALGNSVQKLRRKLVTALAEGLAFFGPSSVDLTAANPHAEPTKPANEKAAKEPNNPAAEQLVSSIVKPQTHLDVQRQSRMKPSDDSPFGMEVVLKQSDGTYQSLDVAVEGGTARVDIQPKQIYAVRLFNDSAAPIGCRLTIDGINIFALSLDPNYKGKETIMELQPHAKFLIKGWHHSGEISHEFRVTNYGDSPAAKFGVVDGVGILTATFYRAIVPVNYKITRGFATGLGDEVDMRYRDGQVRFDNPIGAVSVRYFRPAHPTDLPGG
jgi:hypothetical protein